MDSSSIPQAYSTFVELLYKLCNKASELICSNKVCKVFLTQRSKKVTLVTGYWTSHLYIYLYRWDIGEMMERWLMERWWRDGSGAVCQWEGATTTWDTSFCCTVQLHHIGRSWKRRQLTLDSGIRCDLNILLSDWQLQSRYIWMCSLPLSTTKVSMAQKLGDNARELWKTNKHTLCSIGLLWNTALRFVSSLSICHQHSAIWEKINLNTTQTLCLVHY